MKNYIKELKLNKPDGLTLYEFNQQTYSQMAPLNEISIVSEIVNITQWFSKEPDFKYFMFLCREKNDYTIFNFQTKELDKARDELLSLILSRGAPVSIEYDHDLDTYEIWIKNLETTETNMYRLFDCNDFVIEI